MNIEPTYRIPGNAVAKDDPSSESFDLGGPFHHVVQDVIGSALMPGFLYDKAKRFFIFVADETSVIRPRSLQVSLTI